jgi:hypothetical protein
MLLAILLLWKGPVLGGGDGRDLEKTADAVRDIDMSILIYSETIAAA